MKRLAAAALLLAAAISPAQASSPPSTTVRGVATDAFMAMAPATYRGKVVAYVGFLGFSGVASINEAAPEARAALYMIVCTRTCTKRTVTPTTMSSSASGKGTFAGRDSRYGKIGLTWLRTGESAPVESGFCQMGLSSGRWVYDSNWTLASATGITGTSTPARIVTGKIGSWAVTRSACAVTLKDAIGELRVSMG